MEWVALVLAVVALGVALRAASALSGKVEGLESSLRSRESQIADLREEIGSRLDTVRRHLAQVAHGTAPSESQILAGQLYEDVDAEGAHRIYTNQPGTVVLDVRSPGEYEGGHVKGALHIPVEQIEQRWQEVPRDTRVIVHCAGGGRSAATCELLSSAKGYTNLVNVAGPLVSAWPGEVEQGPSASR